MRFGMASMLMWSFNVRQVIRVAHRLDLAGVEIWGDHLDRDGWAGIERERARRGIELTLHAPTADVNLTSFNRAMRRAALAETKRMIELAHDLCCTKVIVHPGRKSAARHPAAPYHRWQLDVFAELAEVAERAQISLCVEAMERTSTELIGLPAELAALFSGIDAPHLAAAVDTAHVASHGADLAAFLAHTPRIGHVHLSDFDPAHVHRPLGAGSLDLRVTLDVLHRTYDGLVILEGYDLSDERGAVRQSLTTLDRLGYGEGRWSRIEDSVFDAA